MALPRNWPFGRGLDLKSSATCIASTGSSSGRNIAPYRSFVSTSCYLQNPFESDHIDSAEAGTPGSQNPISAEQRSRNARSIKLLRVPYKASRGQVKAFFKDAGFEVRHILMRMDRFRYEGTSHASVELVDEAQAKRAIQELKENKLMGSEITLRPLAPDFYWGNPNPSNRGKRGMVFQDKAGIRQAVLPYVEGRRVRISAAPPYWKGRDRKDARSVGQEAVECAFDRFGIEAMSKFEPQLTMTGHARPKHLCHIDLITKEGADEAISALNNTEIEGVPVMVQRSRVDEYKALAIRNVSTAWFLELKQRGLTPSNAKIHAVWTAWINERKWNQKSSVPAKN